MVLLDMKKLIALQQENIQPACEDTMEIDPSTSTSSSSEIVPPEESSDSEDEVLPLTRMEALNSVNITEGTEIYLLGCLKHLDKHQFHSLISCGYLLLFTSITMKCDHGSDRVSTQSMLDGRTDKHYSVRYRSTLLCKVCCCLHVKYIVYKYLTHECLLGHQS